MGVIDDLKLMVNGSKSSLDLIPLLDKPKEWREVASNVIITLDQRLKRIELLAGTSIGLSVTILGIIIKLALGG